MSGAMMQTTAHDYADSIQGTITRVRRGRRKVILCAIFLALGFYRSAIGAENPNDADHAFLAWAIQIEIQQQDMGRLAVRRGQTPEVRDLGNYLVERHRQAQQRFQKLAAQLNVPLSEKLSAEHLKIQERYASIPSLSFDKAFVRHEVGDYRYFLAHFEAASRSVNALIREYASNELPRLREDQSKITALMGQLNGRPSHAECGCLTSAV